MPVRPAPPMRAACSPGRSPRPPASTPIRRGPPVSRNGLKKPMALEPPPTQATRAAGSTPASASWACVSRPITDWNSRTMSGKGDGPSAEPSR